MMTTPRFSVVIPTRERADTLRFALKTCVEQAFDDYEIVVSDNHSSPATRAVVDELASPKVRYVRTAEPVAMSANWEFGVSHARGEYVTVLGDDDGLLPHALAQLDELARAHKPKAIRWDLAFYTWPTFSVAGHENYLRIPLGGALCEQDGERVIRLVVGALERYEELPMVYNAVVRREVLDEIRRRAGKIFPHTSPDVYSGFAVAHVAGRFLSTNLPMSIRGVSRASTGISALFNPGQTQIVREYHTLNDKAGFGFEPMAPQLPVLAACTADSFLLARRLLFPELNVTLDRKELARTCLNRIRTTESGWPGVLAAVRGSMEDDPSLVEWFDSELAGTPYTPPPPVTYFKPAQLGFDGKNLHLDASAFGVADVADAARLCEQILNRIGHPAQTELEGTPAVVGKVLEAVAPLDATGLNTVRWALGFGEILDQIHRLKDQNRILEEQAAELRGQSLALQATLDGRDATIRRLEAQLCEADARWHRERRWSLKRPLRGVKRLLAAIKRRASPVP